MKNTNWYKAAIREAREAGDYQEAQELEREQKQLKRAAIAGRHSEKEEVEL